MRNFIRLTLLIATSTALFACKPKQQAPAPVAETGVDETAATEAKVAARARDVDACKLTMSAPESADWTTYWTPSDSSNRVQSIHWANAQEREAQEQTFQAYPLVINCSSSGNPSVAVTLTASEATDADIPLSSGSYPIFGNQQPPVKGAQMLASTLTFNGRSFDARNGTLTVSRFDLDGVEGSFVIDGVETNEGAAPIHLEGTFEIPCVGGLMQSKCTASKAD